MSMVRLRRLTADSDNVLNYVKRHPRLVLVKAEGEPPERYQIEYKILGLRQKDDDLIEVRSHLVEISLPLGYPRMAPQSRMLTPIFHPNIAPHAICIGDHWSPGESLSSIVARIGELISYQTYNTKSPLNGEAARWVNEHLDEVPLDAVSMILDDPSAKATPRPVAAVATAPRPRPAAAPAPAPAAPPPPAADPQPAPNRKVTCTGCSTSFRFNPALAGRRVQCPKCQEVLVYPSA
jgi:ubiquitin-protein ligase